MNRVAACLFLSLLITFPVVSARQSADDPDHGVDITLAKSRKQWIASPEYFLKASIPEKRSEAIRGELQLQFTAENTDHDLVLDFTPGPEFIDKISLNGKNTEWRFVNEHIVIGKNCLKPGKNTLMCHFIMGDMSLNRRDKLLYTLFVPDRARTAFPCFDQPDMKGPFALELDLPSDWNAVANGPMIWSRNEADGRRRMAFAPSHPLPTYLMAFVAGKLSCIEETRGKRTVQLFHMEDNPDDLKRNVPEIFNMVFSSLAWMETYTGIKYPFDKYDLILVPSFQYGGMEHCGATLYRATRLILDEQATLDQLLSRAGLIAHETAHMWFGDLVTMPWFDEVWLKEVFAGFMADKMVKTLFPKLDHRLKFFLGHTPPALSVDRSAGNHPITQELKNLSEAGTLYGHLIYHKAPIIMEQLENRVGQEKLRLALGRYLKDHAYGNAGWDSLIDLLSEEDGELKHWSRSWVYEKGLPTIRVIRRGSRIHLSQSDDAGTKRCWSQQIGLVLIKGEMNKLLEMSFDKKEQEVLLPKDFADPDLVLLAANGRGYGRIISDRGSYAFLLGNPMALSNPLWRGAAWLTLWEGALDGSVHASDLVDTALRWMETETNTLLLERILGDFTTLYWQLLNPKQQSSLTRECENRLWKEMQRRPESIRMTFLDTVRNIGSSSEFVKKMEELLRSKGKTAGLVLSEQKEFDLILNLSIFSPPEFDRLVTELSAGWKSINRRDQLEFLRPLFSPVPADWLTFFRTVLTKAENREQEPWVLAALSLIHHTLRGSTSRELIPEILGLMPEIQKTGDIFFPIGWVSESLKGHNSPEAAALVRGYLDNDKTLSGQMKMKILQGADILLRRNDIQNDLNRRLVTSLCDLERPRNVDNPDMLDKASRLIGQQLHGMGWRVRFQNVPYPGGTARNVSVLWGAEESPRLVVGAHYDVCGNTPGADDNASGVAVLLALAGQLSRKKPHPLRSVELVAYALEEPPFFATPFMGSLIHAQSLKRKKKDIVLMISLDMVGHYKDPRSFLACIGKLKDRDIVYKVAGAMDSENMLGICPLVYPESQKGLDWSDHRNFWTCGFPAILLHSSPFFQNPDYHKPGDQPDGIDYPRLSSLSRALFNLIEQWPFE